MTALGGSPKPPSRGFLRRAPRQSRGAAAISRRLRPKLGSCRMRSTTGLTRCAAQSACSTIRTSTPTRDCRVARHQRRRRRARGAARQDHRRGQSVDDAAERDPARAAASAGNPRTGRACIAAAPASMPPLSWARHRARQLRAANAAAQARGAARRQLRVRSFAVLVQLGSERRASSCRDAWRPTCCATSATRCGAASRRQRCRRARAADPRRRLSWPPAGRWRGSRLEDDVRAAAQHVTVLAARNRDGLWARLGTGASASTTDGRLGQHLVFRTPTAACRCGRGAQHRHGAHRPVPHTAAGMVADRRARGRATCCACCRRWTRGWRTAAALTAPNRCKWGFRRRAKRGQQVLGDWRGPACEAAPGWLEVWQIAPDRLARCWPRTDAG